MSDDKCGRQTRNDKEIQLKTMNAKELLNKNLIPYEAIAPIRSLRIHTSLDNRIEHFVDDD